MVLLKSTAGLSEATCQQLLLDMDTYKRPQLQELCKMAKVSAGGSVSCSILAVKTIVLISMIRML